MTDGGEAEQKNGGDRREGNGGICIDKVGWFVYVLNKECIFMFIIKKQIL